MFGEKELGFIRSTLKKGNNVLIRPFGKDIQIMEEKAKVICHFDKSRLDEDAKQTPKK